VHSKTIVELVQATDHASNMGYQLLIPLYCNHWGKARGSPEPILIAVYLDELSTQLGSAKVGCTVGNMVVNYLKFADDICVFSPSISGLQCFLNICGDYAAEHEIIFNCIKTIGVLFCPKKYKQPAPSNVFLNGVSVQFLNQVKYLGVWIDASLKDDDDIQRQVKSLYCAANKLGGTFDQCTPAVKNTLFRAYCMPMYDCHLWSKYTRTSMKRLRAAYNNAYRIMHYIPRNVSVGPHQVNHCVTTFDAVLRNNLYRFFCDAHLHPTFLFDRFKCLMLLTNLHFSSIIQHSCMESKDSSCL